MGGAGPYVGWFSINPTITFNFGTAVNIDSVTIYVDDANDIGLVRPPETVDIAMGGTATSFAITDPVGSAPFSVTFSGLGLMGSSLDLTLNSYQPSKWVFLSEVTFDDSTAVPEPSTLLLLSFGLAGLAGWRWRQARLTNTS